MEIPDAASNGTHIPNLNWDDWCPQSTCVSTASMIRVFDVNAPAQHVASTAIEALSEANHICYQKI